MCLLTIFVSLEKCLFNIYGSFFVYFLWLWSKAFASLIKSRTVGLVRPEFQAYFLPTAPWSRSYCDAPVIDGTIKALTRELGVNQFSSVAQLLTPWTAVRQASLSITNFWSLLKLMSIESVMPSNHLILCRPLLLPPSIFPSIRVFSNESVLRIGWPEYWSFSFSIIPSNEYWGLISFRMD